SDRDWSSDVCSSDLDAPLAHPAGARLKLLAELVLRPHGQVAVPADDEAAAAAGHTEEEVHGAEVAVLDPDVALVDQGQDLADQGALLGMGILAGDEVGDQHQGWVEYRQAL